MPALPAICNNPDCGAIFPSGFAVEGGGSMSVVGCSSGPCPQCGNMGRVPNGEYGSVANQLSAKLHDISDLQLLKSIQRKIENALNVAKPSEIASHLENEEPAWQEIWNLIPENKVEAFALLQLILAFIATAIAIYSITGKPAEKTTIINQSFDRYYFEAPSGSQNENKLFRIKPLVKAIKQTRT